MKKSVQRFERIVKGIIIANEWNENGKAIGAAIYSAKEDVFLIAPNKCAQDLLRFIQMKVKVRGEISLLPDGHKIILVSAFKVLDGDLRQPKKRKEMKGK